MKKLLLSIFSIGTTLVTLGQVSITADGSSTDISGTVVTVPVDASQSLASVKFHVKNLTGSTKDISITRVLVTPLPDQWTDQVCWSIIGAGIGNCYVCSGNTWNSPSEEMAMNAEGELKPQVMPNNVEGSVRIRYYIKSNGAYLDSIDVQWNSLSSSVKENPEVTMSVYPNPVASWLTVAPANFDGQYTIKMTDVLGKVILDQKTSGTEKIDVSEFKNGVYLVTVYSNGKAVTTRRIVVKH